MSTETVFLEQPHRRRNALTGEWVLVSPHRAKRPWQGQREKTAVKTAAAYDPECYLCPGNQRAGGAKNPVYTEPFVFTNDFSSLLPETPAVTTDDELMSAASVRGECRVMCFSPQHHLTLPAMAHKDIVAVVDTWRRQTQELSARYRYVQVFENKGEIMGCSNPHPHCQIWAGNFLPEIVSKEETAQRDWFKRKGTPLLRDYAVREQKENVRVVTANRSWLAVVPFWAVWPYETLLLPLRTIPTLMQLNQEETEDLADIIKRLTAKYDNLFDVSFPYSMGWHQFFQPEDADKGILHAHFYPPLLRSATVRKFMVGYEMLAESQRDILPETAAETLRNLPDTL